ncbi:hypothetical protein M0804_005332 [Polistes exclamans]|nr:hypothetical protein M0804_005332 [Polistes exclamans]
MFIQLLSVKDDCKVCKSRLCTTVCTKDIPIFAITTFLIVNYSRRICKEINPYKISYMTTDDENILYICT